MSGEIGRDSDTSILCIIKGRTEICLERAELSIHRVILEGYVLDGAEDSECG